MMGECPVASLNYNIDQQSNISDSSSSLHNMASSVVPVLSTRTKIISVLAIFYLSSSSRTETGTRTVFCLRTGTNTVRYKILEGENFGEMAHCNNWRIIFWRMPKSSRKSIMSKFQLSPNKKSPTKTFRRDFTAQLVFSHIFSCS